MTASWLIVSRKFRRRIGRESPLLFKMEISCTSPPRISPSLVDFGNNSYKIKLPNDLKQRGIHYVFHASLLRIHIANDDRLFPGRSESHIWDFGGTDQKWAVERIRSHSGSKRTALFEVEWKAGDTTWLPFDKIEHLAALEHYFEALGMEKIDQLTGCLELITTEAEPFEVIKAPLQIPPSILNFSPLDSLGQFVLLHSLFSSLSILCLRTPPTLTLLAMSDNIEWTPPTGLAESMKMFPFIHARKPAEWTIMHPVLGTIHTFSPAMFRLYILFDIGARKGNFERLPAL